jgi:hypothetical protein
MHQKSDGTFLWVALVIEELRQVLGVDMDMPSGLTLPKNNLGISKIKTIRFPLFSTIKVLYQLFQNRRKKSLFAPIRHYKP